VERLEEGVVVFNELEEGVVIFDEKLLERLSLVLSLRRLSLVVLSERR